MTIETHPTDAGAQPAPAQQPEAQRLAQFLLNMQTRLGSCREACGDEYSMKAWDDYSRAAALLAAAPAQAVAVPAPEWDGKLPQRLQSALNALRLECPPVVVAGVEHEVRSYYQAMHISLAVARRMYGAARDRLEAMDAAQPDPFAARAKEHATEGGSHGSA